MTDRRPDVRQRPRGIQGRQTGLGEASGSATLSFDFGGSTSTASLRTTETTITGSTGISIEKQAVFPDPTQYNYAFSPVIYGQSQPPAYFDGTDPNSGLAPGSTKLNMFGPMRTGFTVNPTDNESGAWWLHTYGTHPDIALNHPARWLASKPSLVDPVPDHCISSNDGYMDCAVMNPRSPDDPADDSFHRMRGFFVYRSGDANPADPANQGMQQTTATAGDPLTLEARVYNYSFAAMPAGSKVHVAFFGMLWNTATAFPADYVSTNQPGGRSFLIGTETLVGGIPAWNATTENPNFVLASTHFDTTGYAGKDIVFWVAVWGENADGTLMQELDGKGLTAIPNTNAPTFIDVAGLEQMSQISDGNGGVETASFSNNIGLFRRPFHILAPRVHGVGGAQNAGPSAPPAAVTDVNTFTVSEVHAKEVSVALGHSTEIFSTVHNGGDSAHKATAYLYDGDPENGGKLFGLQPLMHVEAGNDYKVRVRYTADRCGQHEIYMRVGRNGQLTSAAKAIETVDVPCAESPNASNLSTGGGGCDCSAAGETAGSFWSALAPVGLVAASVLGRRRRGKTPAAR